MVRIVGLVFAFVVVIFCTTSVVDASVPFLKCTYYFRNEVLPEVQGDRFCFEWNGVKLCREPSCPELTCSNPIGPSTFSNCQYCPGTCVHGGKVFNVGAEFSHIDGVNTCTCEAEDTVTCGDAEYNELTLCNSEVTDISHHNGNY